MHRTIQTTGISVLAGVTILLTVMAIFIKGFPAAVACLILWAGIQSIAAFYAFLWALPRSNRDFFAIFVGDALLRVATLGASTVLLFLFKIPYTLPLISLALAYLLLALIQIPFFMQVR